MPKGTKKNETADFQKLIEAQKIARILLKSSKQTGLSCEELAESAIKYAKYLAKNKR